MGEDEGQSERKEQVLEWVPRSLDSAGPLVLYLLKVVKIRDRTPVLCTNIRNNPIKGNEDEKPDCFDPQDCQLVCLCHSATPSGFTAVLELGWAIH